MVATTTATAASTSPAYTTARAPGPRGHFLLGSLAELQRDVLTLFMTLPNDYGDIVRFRLGPAVAHLIRRPDHVRHVLLDNYQNYNKDTPGFRVLRRILGQGLLTSEGAFWLRQRKIMQPAFHKQKIDHFASVMTDVAKDVIESWRDAATTGRPLDMAEEFNRMTLRVVGRTLLGTEVGAEADAIGEAVTVVLEDANARLTQKIPIPDAVPTAQNRRFRAARDLLDRIVFRLIRERRARPVEGDLLGMLMAARDADTGEGMSDQQLRDEVMTIFLSGHETTAGALGWTFYLLSMYPAAARQLREEVSSVLGDRVPTAADLPALKYTSMVLHESMRLYPPAWMITRRAADRDTIGGYDIPAGSFLFASPMVTQRHPEFWPNPEAFVPERCSAEALSRMPKFAYYPFGGGPRGCIGNGFAVMEAQLLTAMVAQRFELDLVGGHPIDFLPLVSLRPKHGIKMVLRPVAH
jgi:cytochrome P450